MNSEKLARLKEDVRIGGKGTPRRKKKVVRAGAAVTSEKQLRSGLQRLGARPMSGFEDGYFFKDDGMVMHFKAAQALQDYMPDIVHHIGADSLSALRAQAGQYQDEGLGYDDDIPDLMENFDTTAQTDVAELD